MKSIDNPFCRGRRRRANDVSESAPAEGFRIESAQDGLEALKALSQATPDLVVLDLMLPNSTVRTC